MSDIEKLHDKLMKCPLSDLLSACAQAEASNMDEKRSDILFMILETRLQKRRMLKRLGMKDDEALK